MGLDPEKANNDYIINTYKTHPIVYYGAQIFFKILHVFLTCIS